MSDSGYSVSSTAYTDLCELVRKTCSPALSELRDPSDPEYTRSFALNDPGALMFFYTFGFVVYRDVLTQDESDNSVNDILNGIEASSCYRRDDPDSWCHFPGNHFSWTSSKPIFSEVLLQNRAHDRVHRAFAALLGEDDLLCNHDRVSYMRPTTGQDGKDEYASTDFLHLDMNPWKCMQQGGVVGKTIPYKRIRDFFGENNAVFTADGLQLQGVLNLSDNREEDGGFQCVPGFARIFEQVFKGLPEDAFDPHRGVDSRFGPSDNEVLVEIHRLAVRVPMRSGSLVLWDQRTPHGAQRNRSDKPRAAQLLKLFPRRLISEETLKLRAQLLDREFQANRIACELRSRRVFGLDVLDAL